MAQSQAVEERAALLSSLDEQRNHVLAVLRGLSEEDLRRSLVPSGWSPAGLVQHLALDVEKFWFRAVIVGEQDVIDGLPTGDDAWDEVAPDVPAVSVFDVYRREIDHANAILAAVSLDAAPAWWPDFFGDWRLHDIRGILLHVITETACHAGHLDITRELIDGKKWTDLTK
jgi:hypothetical protein